MSTEQRYWIDDRYELVINGSDANVVSHVYGKVRVLSRYMRGGYLTIKMGNKSHQLHVLVAAATIGQRPPGLVVNHRDADKMNNAPSNLEYVTIAGNVRHAIEMGRHVSCDPTRMPGYKDGRSKDAGTYKRSWYLQNRERILARAKERYRRSIGINA